MLTTSFTTFKPSFIEISDMRHGVTRLAFRVPMRATASIEWSTVLSVTSLTTHGIPGTRRVIHHIMYGCSPCHSANPAHATVLEPPVAGYARAAAAAARTPALCQ